MIILQNNKTLYPDIVWIDAAHTTVSEQSDARMLRGNITDILI
jgi:hypothetical protein